jgi:hypothetical protein
MAQVSPEHVQPLTTGFATLLVGSVLLIAVLNHYSNKL